MALINCPECNKEISDKVKACPHCGYPMVEDEIAVQTKELDSIQLPQMNPKKKKNLVLFICLAIILVTTSVGGVYFYKYMNNQKAYDSAISLLEQMDYQKAIATFDELNGYKDSEQKVSEIQKTLETQKTLEIQKQLESEVISSITQASSNAKNACNIILNVWQDSGSMDFNSVFKYMFAGDLKNHEWSGLGMDTSGFSTSSWGSLATNMNGFSSTLSTLERQKASTDKNLEAVKNAGSNNLPTIITYYNAYLKLYNAATSPSGNRLNYSSNLVLYNDELNTATTTIDMIK